MRRNALTLALAAGLLVVTVDGGEPTLADVAGQYVARAIDLRCTLNLSRNGKYWFTCGGDVPHTGVAKFYAGRITVTVPTYAGQITHPVPPRIPPDPGSSAWPPSLEDPTPPLVGSQTSRLELMVLVPVRWGPRRYLVRSESLSAFCNSIAEGSEPRGVEGGWEFLRVGDYDKKPGKRPPAECGTIGR